MELIRVLFMLILLTGCTIMPNWRVGYCYLVIEENRELVYEITRITDNSIQFSNPRIIPNGIWNATREEVHSWLTGDRVKDFYQVECTNTFGE